LFVFGKLHIALAEFIQGIAFLDRSQQGIQRSGNVVVNEGFLRP
jgi:hypothetical protein